MSLSKQAHFKFYIWTRLMRSTHIWCGICPVTRENGHINVRHVKPRLHLNIISASFYLSEKKNCLQVRLTYLYIHPMCFYLAANILKRINLLMEILRLKSYIILQHSNNTSMPLCEHICLMIVTYFPGVLICEGGGSLVYLAISSQTTIATE